MHLEQIAKVCHEANRAYCESMGDLSQPLWEHAPSWQRDSAVAGVMAIKQNPGMTPEQGHERWMEIKQEQGWKWGPEKNSDRKEHPCMVPYDQLPEHQRLKDHLFQAVAGILLNVGG